MDEGGIYEFPFDFRVENPSGIWANFVRYLKAESHESDTDKGGSQELVDRPRSDAGLRVEALFAIGPGRSVNGARRNFLRCTIAARGSPTPMRLRLVCGAPSLGCPMSDKSQEDLSV